ncbi:Protein kinase-like domain containing protein [Amanita muscaria]
MSDLFPYDQSTVPDLSDKIERTTEFIGRGGYGTVYKGRWLGAAANATPVTIAIKIIELVPLRDEAQRTKRFKQFTRELSLWCSIQNENILPLLGIARIDDDTNLPAFVCPLMENGNAKDFRSRNPRFPPMLILYDIIKGLHYLHTSQPEIVHGDIKAVNVLINNRCEACLCDFGLSRFLIDNTLWKTTGTHAVGTVRWMAPELLTGDAPTQTKESDMYAYAMTCYEILSGDIPFKHVSNDMVIPIKVTKGERPIRIESFRSDFMWDIITRCWEQEPEGRLPTEKVLGLLRPKADWKEVEEALVKIEEKDAALAKVEKEMAVLKEQMAKAEEDLKALKEEKEDALAIAEEYLKVSGEEKDAALARAEEAVTVQQKQQNEIARLHQEVTVLKEQKAKRYTESEKSLVIGIDVGTTLSGVSYVLLEPGKVPRIQPVMRFPGQSQGKDNMKVPSVVCYDQDGHVIVVGPETDPVVNSILSEIEGVRRAEWLAVYDIQLCRSLIVFY